jgi:biopolymer transport protein ExbD
MQRPKRHLQGDVELNVAAMLDMAFQLLAFFILTYHPAPLEGFIALRLPSSVPVTKPGQGGTTDLQAAKVYANTGLDSLIVTVTSEDDGDIASIRIGERKPVNSLQDFQREFNSLLQTPDVNFEQVVLQVGSRLRYENLMRVLEICSQTKMASGERITKLNIVELPGPGN